MKKNKQPKVFVARELRIPDSKGFRHVFGWFVSKAYLTKELIEYTTSGDENHHYIVDFNLCPAIFAMDDGVRIFAENGDCETKSRIFEDYNSCKEYVDNLNSSRIEYFKNSKSAYRWTGVIEETFKEVMDYANYLEIKLIPVEERSQKNYMSNALESAKALNADLGDDRTFDC